MKDSEVFWSEEEANIFCIDYMNKSAGYKQCLEVPNISPENAIADCVADIQVNIHCLIYFDFAANINKITKAK